MDHDDEDDEEPPLEKVEEEPLDDDDDDDDDEEEEEEDTLLASAAANASSCAASLELTRCQKALGLSKHHFHIYIYNSAPGLILFDLLVHRPPLPHLKIQSGFRLK